MTTEGYSFLLNCKATFGDGNQLDCTVAASLSSDIGESVPSTCTSAGIYIIASVTAVPDQKEGNWSREMGIKNHTNHQAILGVTNNKIMTAQFECYQKIMQTTEEYEGPHCNRTWDGWLCWDTTAAGQSVDQNCPDYFQDFDPSGAANNQAVAADYPVGCKVAQFLHFYLTVCNYFWMLCEGIYLHTLIVVAVFAEKQHLLWYYLLGWGFPLIPSCVHAVARSLYFDDYCWISSETHLLYIVHGPICVALLVNLFFLLNIVRVLITKLKVTHQAESNLYMKAVRATLILVPLLGIEFVLVPWAPQGRVALEIFNYVTHILMHYQGLLVATIFCFFNGEVQSVLRRHWNQYMIQFEHSFAHSDGLRSTSYTVSSSFTDGQSFSVNHDCPSEHLNGKSFNEMENVAFKPEKLYE
ncbi:Calcitonin gene-related peptide type 1 receptor, partial [Ophiophagus hannah]